MGDKFVWITVIATIAILGAIVYFGSSSAPRIATPKKIDAAELIRDHSQRLGEKTAKYTVVEFADFQCPACAATYPELKKLLAHYGDKIQLIIRNLPLAIHPHADIAARAAIAAGNQGKFFEMHDFLYERQSSWSTKLDPKKTLVGYAEELKLNMDQFNKDLADPKTTDIISTDLGDAEALGLTGTPTIYINEKRYNGSPDFNSIKTFIDTLK